MDKPSSMTTNNSLALLINNIKTVQLSLTDWQTEKLNFIPLRGSCFAHSEADFDLEEQINKFLSPLNNKKVMLLMGDSGAGKSLYTQGLVNKLWQNFSAQSPIPIWITLPSLKDPVNKVIEETFDTYGFSKDQIEEIRKTRSFIFILDAYDEIRCEKNLYQTNNLDKWNAKIIITCRREYLYHKDNYKLFFAPFVGDKIQYSQYEEIYIRPFNANQIQTYVQQYIKTHIPNWANPERYIKAIEEITGLKELIKTPFMLKLAIEVLPQIFEKYATVKLMERKKVTQAALYDVFIEQWFIRQEKKLKEAKLIKEGEDIKPEFWAYAKKLAQEMHKANLTQIIYNPNEESDLFSAKVNENIWSKFFTPKNPRIELLRIACLVRETCQHHYAFIHSSLLEYFLTRNLFENITKQSSELTTNVIEIDQETYNSQTKKITPIAVISSISKINSNNNQDNRNFKEDYFNQRLIVKEDNTLQFLADRVLEQKTFMKLLFDKVYSSKNNPQNKIAAANAITILNKANVPFSGMDLSKIEIPEADLSNALLDGTNMSGGNLNGVNLRQSYLSYANLSDCKMDQIELGVLPFIISQSEVLNTICFSHNGCLLAVGSKNDILIYDLKAEKSFGRLSGHTGWVNQIAFHPDNKILASCSEDKTIRLWNTSNLTSIGLVMEGHTKSVESISFNTDGKILASASNDETVCLWNVATQLSITDPLRGHHREVRDVTFSHNGTLLVSVSWDEKIQLWDIKAMPPTKKSISAGIALISVAFSPDDRLLACGSTDHVIQLWDINSVQLIATLKGHTSSVDDLAFSPNGKVLASCSEDHLICLWDVETHMQLGQPLAGHTARVSSVKFSPDGKILASGSWDKNIRFWDVSDQKLLEVKFDSTNNRTISSVIFSADSKQIITGGGLNDQIIRFWNIEQRRLLDYTLNGHTSAIKCLALNSESDLLASASSDASVRLWNIKEKQQVCNPLRGHAKINSFDCVAISPDGKILVSGGIDKSSGWSGIIYSWDIKQQQTIDLGIAKPKKPIESLAFSPDGKLLAVGGRHLRLWNIYNRDLYWQPKHKSGSIKCVVFSPNGKILASAGGIPNSLTCLWDVVNRKLLNAFNGHENWVICLAFSPDSKLLVSGGRDNIVKLYSVENLQLLRVCYKGVDLINSIAFSNDGKYIAIVSGTTLSLCQNLSNSAEHYNFYLVCNKGPSYLNAHKLNLTGVQELSLINLRTLKQHGAINVINDLHKDDKDIRLVDTRNMQSDNTEISNFSSTTSDNGGSTCPGTPVLSRSASIDFQANTDNLNALAQNVAAQLNDEKVNVKTNITPIYSSQTPQTFFKPAAEANTKNDIKQKSIVLNEKDEKKVKKDKKDIKDKAHEKEKCCMM